MANRSKSDEIPFFSVPREVYLNKRLDRSAILLFLLIDRLNLSSRGCFASNGYLACILNTTITNIQQSLNRLIAEGYVEKKYFEGRLRMIRINKKYPEIHQELLEKQSIDFSNFLKERKEKTAKKNVTNEKRVIRKTKENN
ncbi:MAG: hypothetical protein KBG27_09845 [Flexilinea sp.]|nr:hypothetical protein [Flexilinea sp.]